MDFQNNKYIQVSSEILLIFIGGYLIYSFFPNAPWWIIAIISGLVAFGLNTKVPSFLTGFLGVAILWGLLAYQLNSPNEGLLANKVGAMLGENIGELNATHLMLITAALGGIVGGFGAMTGALGRKKP